MLTFQDCYYFSRYTNATFEQISGLNVAPSDFMHNSAQQSRYNFIKRLGI